MDASVVLIVALIIFLVLIFIFTYLCDIGPWSSVALALIFVLVFTLASIDVDNEVKKGGICAEHLLLGLLIAVAMLYLILYIIIVATRENSI